MKTEPEEVFHNSLKKSGIVVTVLKAVSGSLILLIAMVGAVLLIPFALVKSLFKSKK